MKQHRGIVMLKRLRWVIRRVWYGPTLYDMWLRRQSRYWDVRCWRQGGGTLVYPNRGGLPRWLRYLP